MRSRRPAVACNDVFRKADGSTERQQSLRQAYGESDPAEDVSHILTGLRDDASRHKKSPLCGGSHRGLSRAPATAPSPPAGSPDAVTTLFLTCSGDAQRWQAVPVDGVGRGSDKSGPATVVLLNDSGNSGCGWLPLADPPATDLAECATWISFGSRSSSTLTIRSRLVDGGPRLWAGLSWAPPRTSSRLGRLPIGCRACCSCRFRRRRQARTDSILTSVRSIKQQKSNVSFPSVLGGPTSGSVTRRGWYSQTLKAMSSASFVDGFGPMPRSRRHGTTLRRS